MSQRVNLDDINETLDRVYNTRLKRKAKTVGITCAEFILTDVFIFYQAIELADSANKSVTTGFKAMIGISIAYAAILGGFTLIHGLVLSSKSRVDPRVEEAFEQTNSYPLVDSLLELGLIFKFREKAWWVALIFWGAFLAIAAALVVLSLLTPDFDVESSTTVAVIAAIVQMYEITGGFAEYWIWSQNSSEEGGGEDEAAPQVY